MGLNAVALFAVAVAATILGGVVYLRAPSRHANRLWCLHSVLVAAWALLTFRITTSDSVVEITLILRIAHLLSAFVLVTFVDFCWVFPERIRAEWERPRSALYASALVFGGLASTPALVRSVTPGAGGPDVEFGWPLALLGLYSMGLILHANRLLWLKSRQLYGVARVQTVYVLAGAIGFQSLLFLTNIILPMLTSQTDFARWGVVCYLFTIVTVAVAMAKHSLWDLTTVGRRSAGVVVSVLSVVGAGTISVYLLAVVNPLFSDRPVELAVFWTVLGFGLGAAFVPIYQSLRGLFATDLAEERRRANEMLAALDASIVRPPQDEFVLVPLLDAADRCFGAAFIEAYLRRADGAYARVVCMDPHGYLEHNRKNGHDRRLGVDLVRRLRIEEAEEPLHAGDIMRFGRDEDVPSQIQAFRDLHATVIVPLIWQDETFGMIVIGPKMTRDMYSSAETSLFRSLGSHAAIAVKNEELQRQILAEKERTEKLISKMGSGVIGVDARGIINVVNPAACDMLRADAADLNDRPISVLPSGVRDCLSRTIEQCRPLTERGDLLRPVCNTRVTLSTFALTGAGGSCEGAGVVIRDLSTEDALERAEREAEQLRFIRAVSAGMAHEIRNPLVAIQTFAELAPQRLDDPEFRMEFLDVARSEVGRLEDLVSQFMTLARPATQATHPVDVPDLVDKVASVVSARAENRRIKIVKLISPDVTTIRANETRLHQALVNLLMNALDATPPEGRVEIRASRSSHDGEPTDGIQITVWNSGSFIPPEDRASLFEPFFTTKTSGTGLGLTICHTIAEEHGGRIVVESEEDTGTAFTLLLPLAPHPDRHPVSIP